MEVSNRSLQELFFDLRYRCDASDPLQWSESVELSQKLSAAVEAAQLFSPNELSEEIATADLKFLLLPFYQATLLSRCQSQDPTTKTTVLRKGLECYDVFLSKMWTYQLCGETATRSFRDEESLTKRAVNGSGVSREQKIQRFKRERWIRKELERMHGARVDADEEQERSLWCLELEAAFLKAVSEQHMIQQEIEILEYAAHVETVPETRHSPDEARSKVTTLLRNFAQDITQKREKLKSEVFRPSHILPTMTVEQFAEIEYQRALQQQKSESGQEQAARQDSDEEDVYKARAWDDWKDEHPRGYGNSKLKPCS